MDSKHYFCSSNALKTNNIYFLDPQNDQCLLRKIENPNVWTRSAEKRCFRSVFGAKNSQKIRFWGLFPPNGLPLVADRLVGLAKYLVTPTQMLSASTLMIVLVPDKPDQRTMRSNLRELHSQFRTGKYFCRNLLPSQTIIFTLGY